jgi:hypothetical protein
MFLSAFTTRIGFPIQQLQPSLFSQHDVDFFFQPILENIVKAIQNQQFKNTFVGFGPGEPGAKVKMICTCDYTHRLLKQFSGHRHSNNFQLSFAENCLKFLLSHLVISKICLFSINLHFYFKIEKMSSAFSGLCSH